MIERKKRYLVLSLLMTVLLISCGGAEQTDTPAASEEEVEQPTPTTQIKAPAEPDYYKDEQGQALAGYDAVAYHNDMAAVAGVAEYKIEWGGAAWLFANEANLNLFKANPEKFAPANGGYCTFGIILEKKLDGNPQVWHLSDNQLYMFLNEEVKGKFLQAEEVNLAKVAENWPKVKGTTP